MLLPTARLWSSGAGPHFSQGRSAHEACAPSVPTAATVSRTAVDPCVDPCALPSVDLRASLLRAPCPAWRNGACPPFCSSPPAERAGASTGRRRRPSRPCRPVLAISGVQAAPHAAVPSSHVMASRSASKSSAWSRPSASRRSCVRTSDAPTASAVRTDADVRTQRRFRNAANVALD